MSEERRNWSEATLLARLLKVLEEDGWGKADEMFARPNNIDNLLGGLDRTAADVIELLKDRVIMEQMKDRL